MIMKEENHKTNNFIRRFLFFALLLALLIAASEALYRYALTDTRDDILNRNTTEIELAKEPENTIDLLVLGDSLSYQVLSPMTLYEDTGITSYIAGESLQDPVEMLHMYEAAVARQNPRVLLVEAHALVHSDGAVYTAQEFVTDRITTMLPVFRLHNLWKEAVVPADEAAGEDAAAAVASGEHLVYKGFHLSADVVPAGDLTGYMSPSDSVISIPADNRLVFKMILNDCRKRGITVILFSSPSPANYGYGIHNGIQEFADANGLTYIDLNEHWQEIGIDWQTDTVDGGDHLNIFGAAKATAYLEPILAEYGLPDHREASHYEAWDSLLPEYHEAEEQYIRALKENITSNEDTAANDNQEEGK